MYRSASYTYIPGSNRATYRVEPSVSYSSTHKRENSRRRVLEASQNPLRLIPNHSTMSNKNEAPAGAPPAYTSTQDDRNAGPSTPTNTNAYPTPPAGAHVPDARYGSPAPYQQPVGSPYGAAPPVGYYGGAAPNGPPPAGYYPQGPPMGYQQQAQPGFYGAPGYGQRYPPNNQGDGCLEAMLATFACCCCLDACLLF